MIAIDVFRGLIGEWRATNRLWLSPDDPVRESESLAVVRLAGCDQFAEIEYTWAFDGKPQQGRVILGQDPGSHAVKGVWFDSWHMRNDLMTCLGGIDPTGVIAVKGTYAAPPDPDWGWEILIEPDARDAFRLSMYNIPPGGEKELAVEVSYTRVSPGGQPR
jgi:hypothetical protein